MTRFRIGFREEQKTAKTVDAPGVCLQHRTQGRELGGLSPRLLPTSRCSLTEDKLLSSLTKERKAAVRDGSPAAMGPRRRRRPRRRCQSQALREPATSSGVLLCVVLPLLRWPCLCFVHGGPRNPPGSQKRAVMRFTRMPSRARRPVNPAVESREPPLASLTRRAALASRSLSARIVRASSRIMRSIIRSPPVQPGSLPFRLVRRKEREAVKL
jgi:hypothetical protein